MRILPGNPVPTLTLLTVSTHAVARISLDIRPAAVREWNDESATGKPDTLQLEVNYARLCGTLALEILAAEPSTSWYFLAFTMMEGKSRDPATQDRDISELSLGMVAHSIELKP